MKVALPRAAKGVHLPELFEITMNEFDVERLLPSLFYLAVTKGRPRGSRVNEPENLAAYMESLLGHPSLVGFSAPGGRRLLERWVRASVIHVGTVTKARKGEQIEFVLPRTILAYKTGLPRQEQRQRGVHLFIYHQLRRTLDEVGGSTPSDELLKELFRTTFGKGVTLGDGPSYDGSFDGAAELDLETLLTLYYLDGFKPTPAKAAPKEAPGAPAMPGLSTAAMVDTLAYLGTYRDELPILALTKGLMALVNLGLYVYTVKLAYAIDEIVTARTIPSVFGESTAWGPEIYVDFTRARHGPSHRLARACFERELEQMRRLFGHLVRLKTLKRFSDARPAVRDELSKLNAEDKGAYVLALLDLADEGWVAARAEMEFDQVVQDSVEDLEQQLEREEAEVYLDGYRRRHSSPLEAYLALLVAEQQRTQVEPLLKWLISVGGLKKQFGLLVGGSRADAAYVMSDDLLATLIQVVAAQSSDTVTSSDGTTSRVPMSRFLAFLRVRLGVVVDTPPAFLDDAQSRATAKENLRALKRRLREMGFFSDLSDDFAAQYLSVSVRRMRER